jgi:hypothetical protein
VQLLDNSALKKFFVDVLFHFSVRSGNVPKYVISHTARVLVLSGGGGDAQSAANKAVKDGAVNIVDAGERAAETDEGCGADSVAHIDVSSGRVDEGEERAVERDLVVGERLESNGVSVGSLPLAVDGRTRSANRNAGRSLNGLSGAAIHESNVGHSHLRARLVKLKAASCSLLPIKQAEDASLFSVGQGSLGGQIPSDPTLPSSAGGVNKANGS